MDLENENKTENSAVEQNDSSREGYQSAQQGYDNSNYSRAYRSDGRPQRPRFSRTPDRPYSNRSNSSNDDGGFRPEGFGTGLQEGSQHQQSSYRPRYNNGGEGGYQQRQQGGYRPRYNNNDDGDGGGYQLGEGG